MSDPTLFGLLILDRDPFGVANFWGLSQAWLQDAGGFAALGLAAYLLYALRVPAEQAESAKSRAGVSAWMLIMAVLTMLAYAVYGVLIFTGKGFDQINGLRPADPNAFVKYEAPKFSYDYQPLVLMAGGLFALLGIGQPFVASLSKIRFRRIGALAKLGVLEVIRSRALFVYVIFLIPMLFPITWFIQPKPEDELRDIIDWMSYMTQLLAILPALLLGAFAIPNDVKNQNIYTIVTKPVERFEIVFGRYLGYLIVLTLALVVMTTGSWLFIRLTGVNQAAKDETLKARVPLRGKLAFQSRRGSIEGTNVGREFDYRKYIAGDPSSSQRAIWSFASLPGRLASDRDYVPCEFTFDIFRMTKGEENRGVNLAIRITTFKCPQVPPAEAREGNWRWENAARYQEYEQESRQLVAELQGIKPGEVQNPATVLALARPGTPAWRVVNQLAEKYGFYEVTGKEVYDYHPADITVPVGIFKNALSETPAKGADGIAPPILQVAVKCDTKGQLLGMAEGDLYVLEGNRTFDENYFKAAVGLWCRIALVLGLAVTISTYLAGVISFLVALILFIAGYASDHLTDMASGRSNVGGPFRAVNQLLKAEQPTAIVDSGNPLTRAAEGGDVVFSWLVRRFINLVPDVYAYSWTDFVSEGFNIPLENLVMNLVVLVAYLLPWFILGYFLIRSREVAA
ncbi:hypothetical protein [Fimbriiglobus ruber]|uniref:ABC transporter permease n=1 Tax=Fimbriiglobus ruber TaxID=1908690 RepID=A0A225DW27_9BACT|nr:hypothetical protein [Fimbriiglobus ruber]OWK40515.1 hypothetical protein FRUB_05434 [Fimbriiglobus ruber]